MNLQAAVILQNCLTITVKYKYSPACHKNIKSELFLYALQANTEHKAQFH